MDLRAVAKAYIKKGLSVIPINKNKQPIYEWFKYQNEFMSDADVEKNFKDCAGIGMVCGKISGGVLAIDIDLKNVWGSKEDYYQKLVEAVPTSILDKMVVSTTRSGGYHWICKTDIDGRNTKYAIRATTEIERVAHPNEKMVVTIENRQSGGFICCSPTDGYNIISENKQLQFIMNSEHATLVDILGSFNEVFDEVEEYEKFNEEKRNKFITSPFDDAEEKLDLLGLLTKFGYSIVGTQTGNKIKIKRPGKSDSTHSGYYDFVTNRYINFSTSSEFEGQKSYSAPQVFTRLECNGDWKQSYKKLVEMGYGITLDFTKKINEYKALVKEGNIAKLIADRFNGEVVRGGVQLNGVYFKI